MYHVNIFNTHEVTLLKNVNIYNINIFLLKQVPIHGPFSHPMYAFEFRRPQVPFVQ